MIIEKCQSSYGIIIQSSQIDLIMSEWYIYIYIYIYLLLWFSKKILFVFNSKLRWNIVFMQSPISLFNLMPSHTRYGRVTHEAQEMLWWIEYCIIWYIDKNYQPFLQKKKRKRKRKQQKHNHPWPIWLALYCRGRCQ